MNRFRMLIFFFVKNIEPKIRHKIAEIILIIKIQCQRSNSKDRLPDRPPNAFAPNKPTITINKNTLRYCLGKLRKSFGKSVKNKTPVLKLCNPLAIDKIIKSKEKAQ